MVVPTAFTGIDELGTLLALPQELGVRQGIVHDDIRLSEEFHSLDSHEPHVSGAGTYEIHLSFAHIISSLLPVRYSAIPRTSSMT